VYNNLKSAIISCALKFDLNVPDILGSSHRTESTSEPTITTTQQHQIFRSAFTSDTSDITHYRPTGKSSKLSTYCYRPTAINQACWATYQQIGRPSRP